MSIEGHLTTMRWDRAVTPTRLKSLAYVLPASSSTARLADPRLHSPTMTEDNQLGKDAAELDNEEAKRAAEIIQRTWKGHRSRRELKGHGLSASERWTEVVKDAQFHKEITSPTSPEAQRRSDTELLPAKTHWNHVVNVAKRAARDDNSTSTLSDDSHYGQEAAPDALSDEQRAALGQRRQEAREQSKKKGKMMDLQYWLGERQTVIPRVLC